MATTAAAYVGVRAARARSLGAGSKRDVYQKEKAFWADLERMTAEQRARRQKLETPTRARGHYCVTIGVHEVSNIETVISNSRSQMWYTIKAASRCNRGSPKIEKLVESKKICSHERSFGTSHVLPIDTDEVEHLVLALKGTSAILGRKLKLGEYRFSLDQDRPPIDNGLVKLRDENGNAVGEMRISVSVNVRGKKESHDSHLLESIAQQGGSFAQKDIVVGTPVTEAPDAASSSDITIVPSAPELTLHSDPEFAPSAPELHEI